MPQLGDLSAQKAKCFYGIVYPRETFWVRLTMNIYYNLRYWLQRNLMRNFVHPTKAGEAWSVRTAWNAFFIARWFPGKWCYFLEYELLDLVLKSYSFECRNFYSRCNLIQLFQIMSNYY
jgi:hypothetical protein